MRELLEGYLLSPHCHELKPVGFPVLFMTLLNTHAYVKSTISAIYVRSNLPSDVNTLSQASLWELLVGGRKHRLTRYVMLLKLKWTKTSASCEGSGVLAPVKAWS